MTADERAVLAADLGHPTGIPAGPRAGAGGVVVDPVLDAADPDDDGGDIPDWMRELIP